LVVYSLYIHISVHTFARMHPHDGQARGGHIHGMQTRGYYIV